MSRDDLINTTRAILAKGGYDISPLMSLRSICFDVVGRKGDRLLIIKVLSNIDAFSRENADELKVLADVLHASPIVIGERSSSGLLEPGIVYSRFGIQIISNETLADHILEDAPPFIFAAPGGLYVRLNNELLREVREKEGISLGTLAEVAGVSRRTIQMYESGMGAMIDAALRLEEYLDRPLIETVDPFEYKSETPVRSYELKGNLKTGSLILDHLIDIGFAVTPVERSPFDALSRNKDVVILTGVDDQDEKLIQKAMIASDISRISGRASVIIVEKKHGRDNVESTAIVSKDELKKMDDKNELTDVVLSRGGKQ
jgi:putative transcriptional regulator